MNLPLGMLVLVGPTAVGKSAVALKLAEQLGGEIVSVDSMQVYRGLRVGTAKPSRAQLERVPHHLVDIVDLQEEFNVHRFVELAQAVIAEVLGRKKTPVLCGGTGLYLKALFHGLGQSPEGPVSLRRELEGQTLPDLLKELRAKDPVAYDGIDRANKRRVIRALEIVRLTGRPRADTRANWLSQNAREPCERYLGYRVWRFGLRRQADDLAQRIDDRVEEMFRQGLVEETQQLLSRGLAENRTAMQALGYRQVVDYLQGRSSLAEAASLVKTKTRRYAKRQMTWFRNQMSLIWLEVAPGETPGQTAQRLLDRLKTHRSDGIALAQVPSASVIAKPAIP